MRNPVPKAWDQIERQPWLFIPEVLSYGSRSSLCCDAWSEIIQLSCGVSCRQLRGMLSAAASKYLPH